MTLSKTRLWIAGTVALCLVLTAAAWFLVISPTRAEAAELRTQRADTAVSNDQLQARIDTLVAQFATLDQKRAELAVVQEAMPQDPELALLNRKLEAESLTSGVVLMRVTPGAAVAAVAAPAPAPVPAEGAATEGAATDGTAAAAVPTSTLQAIPVVVEVVGPFADVSTYLQGIQERLGRDFLIESLNVVAEKPAAATGAKPAVTNGDVTMTITGKVFVLPAAAATTSPTVADTAGAGTTDS